MPRRKIEGKFGGRCKIRKRASSSSTSSSSLAKNHRLKRAILVGKRAGSSTPVPTWKMASRSPSLSKQSHGIGSDKGKESQISARRLAATLWEINGLQSPGGGGDKESTDGERDRKSVEKIAKLLGAGLGLTHLLDHSQTPVSKSKDGSMPARHHSRKSSATSEKFQLAEVDCVTNGDSLEVASRDTSSPILSRLKDVSSSLAASKEIVKVLFRLWSRDEQCTSRLTLVSALRVEIDRARHQVDHLIHEQRYSQKDVELLLKEFATEKADWKSREEERVLDATSSLARKLEVERKLRRQSERLNKRLGSELKDTRKRLSEAVREAERERRAREVLEQTCDELARGVGDDKEEVERERQMLQLADVLREERVQMKLAEASYEYEEKNAALERLRSELEVYLGGKGRDGDFGSGQTGGKKEEDEDSGESELDSIELNMDSLNKSYKWSFVNEEEQVESTRASVDEVFKGRRSLSEKIQWENVSLMKKSSDNNNNNSRKQGDRNGFEKARLSEVESQDERNGQKPNQACKDSQGNSMRFSVSLADHFQGNFSKGNKT